MRDIRDLFGVADGPIRWERPAIIFAALVIGDAVGRVAWPLVNALQDGSVDGLGMALQRSLGNPWRWVASFYGNLVVVGLGAVCFRLLRNVFIGLPVLIVGYLALVRSVNYFIYRLVWKHDLRHDPEQLDGLLQAIASSWWEPTRLLMSAVFVVTLFLGLALLRWLRPWQLGLSIGVIGGWLLAVLAWTDFDFADLARNLSVNFIEAVAVLGCLLAGMALSWDPREAETDEVPQAVAQRVSKGVYVGVLGMLMLVSVAFAAIGLATAFAADSEDALPTVLGMAALSMAAAIAAAVIWLRLIYLMWAAIRDGQARTTPGKAAGFLFIPFFNLYWFFQAVAAYPTDYNRYRERHGLQIAPLGNGAFVAFCVCTLATALPLIGYVVWPAAMILQLVVASKVCDAVNSLPDSPHTTGDIA